MHTKHNGARVGSVLLLKSATQSRGKRFSFPFPFFLWLALSGTRIGRGGGKRTRQSVKGRENKSVGTHASAARTAQQVQ